MQIYGTIKKIPNDLELSNIAWDQGTLNVVYEYPLNGIHMLHDAVEVLLIWTGPMVGHVGDGNFHVFFPVDQSNPDEIKTVHDVSVKMAL